MLSGVMAALLVLTQAVEVRVLGEQPRRRRGARALRVVRSGFRVTPRVS